jgi:hypothetical protein
MWRHRQIEKRTGEPNCCEQIWPCTETLKTLAELNEQCLELLAEQAVLRLSNAPPMFRDLIDLWSELDVVSRRRAAACPFLLIDAGFADPYRWRWVGDDCVGDREPLSYTAFFSGNSAIKVARQVFANAWYIVRTELTGAPLFLGMPPHCADLLKACTMRQVTELANQHAGWLRPRWAGRTRVWRELLAAALSSDGVALETARLHGVQLLAMELRALEQVQGKEKR